MLGRRTRWRDGGGGAGPAAAASAARGAGGEGLPLVQAEDVGVTDSFRLLSRGGARVFLSACRSSSPGLGLGLLEATVAERAGGVG